MITREYFLKKNNIVVTLDNNYFYVKLKDQTYYAKYDFNIEPIPDHYIDLMVYYIFYGFGENKTAKVKSVVKNFENNPSFGNSYVEVDIPYYEDENQVIEDLSFFDITLYPSLGNNKLLMFSGGYDSTALKVVFPEAIPIYLDREYDKVYGQNQQKIVTQVGAHKVINNIEQIRIQYVGKQGFNNGHGYTSLLIPYLFKYKANKIFAGVIFDDVAFGYPPGQDLKFGKCSINGGSLNPMNWLKRAGVYVEFPLAGTSELLTCKIVNSSPYKNTVSSCHVPTSKKYCGKCYKCLRKLAFIGKPTEIQSQAIITGEKAIQKRPLKMAVSTVYGVQLIPTDNKVFRILKDFDVSFLDRFNEWYTLCFSSTETLEELKSSFKDLNIKPMTPSDSLKIKQFVHELNNKLYR